MIYQWRKIKKGHSKSRLIPEKRLTMKNVLLISWNSIIFHIIKKQPNLSLKLDCFFGKRTRYPIGTSSYPSMFFFRVLFNSFHLNSKPRDF